MVKTLTQNEELFWKTTQSAPLTPTTTKDGLSWFPTGSLSIGTTLLRGMGRKGFVLAEE